MSNQFPTQFQLNPASLSPVQQPTMVKTLTPMQRPQVAEAFDKMVTRGDKLDMIMGQIPSLFGSGNKATYLGFRAVGMGHADALETLGCDDTDYAMWLVDTPQIEEFVNERLVEMQDAIGVRVVRLMFLRNLTGYFMLDGMVMREAKNGMDKMGPQSAAYLRTARRNYTPKNLLDLERALEPEKHRENITIMINNGSRMYEIIDADEGDVRELDEGEQEE